MKSTDLKLARRIALAHLSDVTAVIPCPICRVLLKTLQRHLRKVHVGAFSEWPRAVLAKGHYGVPKPRADQTSGGTSAPQRSQEIMLCPVCEIRVKTTKLPIHMSRAHRPSARIY